jgi:hypothetical protein
MFTCTKVTSCPCKMLRLLRSQQLPSWLTTQLTSTYWDHQTRWDKTGTHKAHTSTMMESLSRPTATSTNTLLLPLLPLAHQMILQLTSLKSSLPTTIKIKLKRDATLSTRTTTLANSTSSMLPLMKPQAPITWLLHILMELLAMLEQPHLMTIQTELLLHSQRNFAWLWSTVLNSPSPPDQRSIYLTKPQVEIIYIDYLWFLSKYHFIIFI